MEYQKNWTIPDAIIAADAAPEEKLAVLQQYLKSLGKVAIAFSSGVDSTFLLKVAHDVLGDDCLAITAKSGSFPGRELTESIEFCRKEGIRHLIMESDELQNESFRKNPPDRCYICKKALFENFLRTARTEGFSYVAEGSNNDDNGDYRPGLRAVAELKVLSPLRVCNMYKADIRILSKEMELPTWNKQSFACLASRFAYGEEITREKLSMVEKAEQLFMDMGFVQYRVRIHGNLARIEVLPEEFDKIMQSDVRESLYQEMKSYGFSYVTLDLMGYRVGSMNEVLKS